MDRAVEDSELVKEDDAMTMEDIVRDTDATKKVKMKTT